MVIFKVVGIGLLICFLALIIKQVKPEFYIVILLVGSVVLLLLVLKEFSSVVTYFKTIFSKTKLDNDLFESIFKIVGIALLTEFASSICIDTGNSSIGDKIIFAGKIIILVLSLPIITSLLNLIIEIMP